MTRILDTIIEQKKKEVQLLKRERPSFNSRSSDNRSLINALQSNQSLGIIAEVKKASPSKGVIKEDFNPVQIATQYEKGDATGISVLTDEQFFQGSLVYLADIRKTVSKPVLRKDFIIDTIQVEQSAEINADVILLIASCLSDSQMEELYSAAKDMDLESLIEIHSLDELERVMKLEPSLIGINNRDLTTFTVDINTALTIKKYIPSEVTVISESGISTNDQAQKIFEAGIKGILVGESLMRSQNPGQLIRELSDVG